MATEISLALQTIYAELLDRVSAAAFDAAFPEKGTFISKTVRDRRYWYFQTIADGHKIQRYAGPETPDLLERIARHRERRDDERERRTLVSTLVRSASLPRPAGPMGDALATLAAAGVFRLRGVLVGTLAFQTYAAMLGVRLPRPAIQTLDIDIAQFREISVAVDESIPGMLSALRRVDSSFREVPRLNEPGAATSYASKSLRIDFLTPNRGADTDKPLKLPALDTHGQPLRFLDYLLHNPEPTVVLHGAGIHVLVPSPHRYAVHKLIVSRRRAASNPKKEKDRMQAEVLLRILAEKQPHELREAWVEAERRGPQWRQYLNEALSLTSISVRDATLRLLKRTRGDLSGVTIDLDPRLATYHSASDTVKVVGNDLRRPVTCLIDGAVVARLASIDGTSAKQRLKAFHAAHDAIDALVRAKYLDAPIENSQTLRIGLADIGARSKAKTVRRKARPV